MSKACINRAGFFAIPDKLFRSQNGRTLYQPDLHPSGLIIDEANNCLSCSFQCKILRLCLLLKNTPFTLKVLLYFLD